jgi:hypothetical protein
MHGITVASVQAPRPPPLVTRVEPHLIPLGLCFNVEPGSSPLALHHSAVALGLKPRRRKIICGEAVVVCGADASGPATWLRIERKLRLVRRRANQQLVRTNTTGGVRRSAQGNSFDL